jgi:isopentenyl-diphosphate delta-isomerase type 1
MQRSLLLSSLFVKCRQLTSLRPLGAPCYCGAVHTSSRQSHQEITAWERPVSTFRRDMSANRNETWDGAATQQDFMIKDECVLVDEYDNVVGHASKGDAHRFTPTQPHGLLHRAFSVFLFDAQNRLLLQQRALNKITFPGVWTNTCCSHPLHGYEPTEVDVPADVASGKVFGIKRAAIRKLQHELGIPEDHVPLESFQFLTRLRYCARDTDTWGPEAEWGGKLADDGSRAHDCTKRCEG